MGFPAVADSKKVQSYINRLGRAVLSVRAIVAECTALRAAWTAAEPEVTGTPLEGVSLPGIGSWLDELAAWAETPLADGLVAAIRRGHSEEF